MAVKTRSKNTTSRINIDTLPTDVLQDILAYLELEDILNLTMVNRYLQILLPQYDLLWKNHLEETLNSGRTYNSKRSYYKWVLHCVPSHRCIECRTISREYVRSNHVFQLPLCFQCGYDLPKYRLISGAKALEQFKVLSVEDFATLRYSKERTKCCAGLHSHRPLNLASRVKRHEAWQPVLYRRYSRARVEVLAAEKEAERARQTRRKAVDKGTAKASKRRRVGGK